jgi:hypothetical protein
MLRRKCPETSLWTAARMSACGVAEGRLLEAARRKPGATEGQPWELFGTFRDAAGRFGTFPRKRRSVDAAELRQRRVDDAILGPGVRSDQPRRGLGGLVVPGTTHCARTGVEGDHDVDCARQAERGGAADVDDARSEDRVRKRRPGLVERDLPEARPPVTAIMVVMQDPQIPLRACRVRMGGAGPSRGGRRRRGVPQLVRGRGSASSASSSGCRHDPSRPGPRRCPRA